MPLYTLLLHPISMSPLNCLFKREHSMTLAGVAQLDRELSHGPKGRGLESLSVTTPGCEFELDLGWVPEGSQ